MRESCNLRDIIIDRYTPAKSRVQKLARPTCIAAQLLPQYTLGHTQLSNRKPNSINKIKYLVALKKQWLDVLAGQQGLLQQGTKSP